MSTANMFRGTGGPANTTGSDSPALTSVTDLWLRRRAAADDLMQYHKPDWRRYWRWYLNWIQPLTDPNDYWRSNAPDPEAFKVIETLLPKHILGMFSSQEWFTVKGRERNDAEYARMVQSLLVYMTERMNVFPKLYECIKYALIMGHVWGKMTWRLEEEEVPFHNAVLQEDGSWRTQRTISTREVYNDPWLEWVTLDKLWPDPTGQGRWYIEKIDTTLEQIEETQDTRGIYRNLDLLRAMGGHREELDYEEQQDAFLIPTETTDSPDVDGQKVTLLQCWGWVPPHLRPADGAAWRLTVIANGLFEIRDVPIPTPKNRPPYFPIRTIPIPKRLYGESILRWIGPKCDQKSVLSNMRVDEVKLGIWQQYVFDVDAVPTNKQLFEPGGGMPLETHGRSVGDVFALMPRRPVMPEAYREEEAIKASIEDAAAATPLQQGVADTSRQTATEVNTLRAYGDQRFVLQAMWLDSEIKREFLTRGFEYYQAVMPPGRLVRIIGTDYERPVDLSDIQEPVDIVVMSGLEAFGREARLNSINQFVNLAGLEPFASWLRPNTMLKQLAEDHGWRDPDRFILTEQEHAQQQQQSLEMQVKLAQMQAQLETMSKIAVEQAKNQGGQQAEMLKIQGEQQKLLIAREEAQLDMSVKELEAQMQEVEMRIDLEGQRAELLMERQRLQIQLEFARAKAALDLQVAQAKATLAKKQAREGAKPRKSASK